METIVCTQHNKSLKYICFECNILMCSRCSNEHPKQSPSHFGDHIDTIKNILHQVTVKDNNNSNNNYIKLQVDALWNSIRESSLHYESLELSEKEIVNHFTSMHEYLSSEEQRLKSSIIVDKDKINNDIEQKIGELKSIMKMVNLENINNNNTDINNDEVDFKDTTDQYLIANIIKTIQDTESLGTFLERYRYTLFSEQIVTTKDDRNNDDNNVINYAILTEMEKYNNKYGSLKDSKVINKIEPTDYKVQQFNAKNVIMDAVYKSIQVTPFSKPKLIEQQLQSQLNISSSVFNTDEFGLNIVIIGDHNVGKSFFLHRLCKSKFSTTPIVSDLRYKTLQLSVPGKKHNLRVLEFNGDPSIPSALVKKTHAFMILYDLTNEESFNNIHKWCEFIKLNGLTNDCTMLIGTKSDLSNRVIDYKKGKALADKYKILFSETSSKNGHNVKTSFIDITDKILCKLNLQSN